MEYYVDLSLASLSELDLEKSTFSMSGDALQVDTQPQGVRAWHTRVREDPERNQNLVVTNIDLYKKRSASFFQHEYLVLSIQSRPPPEGLDNPLPVTLVRVERRITDRTLPARLGLWGPADDQVTVLGPAAAVALSDDQLYHLDWLPNNAPTLYSILNVICLVQLRIPQYSLLRTSCYAFAGAVIRTIDITLNGNQGVQQQHSLTRQTYFLGCIPAGATQVESVATVTASAYSFYGDSHVPGANLEG